MDLMLDYESRLKFFIASCIQVAVEDQVEEAEYLAAGRVFKGSLCPSLGFFTTSTTFDAYPGIATSFTFA